MKLRLVNGLNGAGALGVSVNGTVQISGVTFGTASATKLVAPSAGVATIAVSGTSPAPATLTAQTLAAGNAYVVFVLGDTAARIVGRQQIADDRHRIRTSLDHRRGTLERDPANRDERDALCRGADGGILDRLQTNSAVAGVFGRGAEGGADGQV